MISPQLLHDISDAHVADRLRAAAAVRRKPSQRARVATDVDHAVALLGVVYRRLRGRQSAAATALRAAPGGAA